MGVFFENAGFVFFKMRVFSKMHGVFLENGSLVFENSISLPNGCVFGKCKVYFYLKLEFFLEKWNFFENSTFFIKWVCFRKMRVFIF